MSNVAVRKSVVIHKLLAGEDEALLVGGDAFLVLDLCLDGRDCVGGFHSEGDCFAIECFAKNLHCVLLSWIFSQLALASLICCLFQLRCHCLQRRRSMRFPPLHPAPPARLVYGVSAAENVGHTSQPTSATQPIGASQPIVPIIVSQSSNAKSTTCALRCQHALGRHRQIAGREDDCPLARLGC